LIARLVNDVEQMVRKKFADQNGKRGVDKPLRGGAFRRRRGRELKGGGLSREEKVVGQDRIEVG